MLRRRLRVRPVAGSKSPNQPPPISSPPFAACFSDRCRLAMATRCRISGGAGSVTITCCTVPVTGRSSPTIAAICAGPRPGGVHHPPRQHVAGAGAHPPARAVAFDRQHLGPAQHARPGALRQPQQRQRAAQRIAVPLGRHEIRADHPRPPARAPGRAARWRPARGSRCPSAAPSPICGAGTPCQRRPRPASARPRCGCPAIRPPRPRCASTARCCAAPAAASAPPGRHPRACRPAKS